MICCILTKAVFHFFTRLFSNHTILSAVLGPASEGDRGAVVDPVRLLAQQPEGHHPVPRHRLRDGAQRAAALCEYCLCAQIVTFAYLMLWCPVITEDKTYTYIFNVYYDDEDLTMF